MGGVAIAWHKSLNSVIVPVEGSTERIACIEMETIDTPLLIANMYLPSRGNHSRDDHMREINILQAIVEKYLPTHDIIIAGDFNASIHRNDPWDSPLKSFIEETKLIPDECTDNTFIHHSNTSASKIDYFLMSNSQLLNEIEVHSQDAINMSSHVPLAATLTISTFGSTQKKSKIKPTAKICHLWNKCDQKLYRETLCSNLCEWSEKFQQTENPLDVEVAAVSMVSCIKHASREAVPQKKVRLKGPRFLAPPHILQLLRKSRAEFKQWDDEGKPPKEVKHTHPCVQPRKKSDLPCDV